MFSRMLGISFLWVHFIFIQLSVGIHLGYFYIHVVNNNPEENGGVQILLYFPSFSCIPRIGFHNHVVSLFLTFSRTSILISVVTTKIYFPTSSAPVFLFLYILSNNFVISGLFGDIMNGGCSLSDNFFCISWYMIFVLYFINMMWHIDF